MHINKPFFLKTIAHLGFQLAVSAVSTNQAIKHEIPYHFAWALASIALVVFLYVSPWILMDVSDFVSFSVRFTAFCVLSVVYGVIMSFYTKDIDEKLVREGVVYTVILFLAMVAIGFTLVSLDVDISPLVFVAFVASIGLIAVYLYIIIAGQQRYRWLNMAGVSVFALYLVINTYFNFMVSDNVDQDLIKSTMDYYLDIVAIFRSLVQYLHRDD